MMKKLPLILGLAFLLSAIVAISLFLRLRFTRTDRSISQNVGSVTYRDEIGVEQIKFEDKVFLKLTGQLGFWEKGVYVWRTAKEGIITSAVPDKILVVLTKEEQPYYKTKGISSDGTTLTVITSLGQEYNEQEKTLIIKLYLSDELMLAMEQEKGQEPYEINHKLMLGLLKMSVAEKKTDSLSTSLELETAQRDKRIKSILDEKGYIFTKEAANLLNRINFFLTTFSLVKSASAQTCTGGLIICGTIVTSKTCSASGPLTCASLKCDDPCGTKIGSYYNGTCVCSDVCDIGDDVDILCSARTTQSQCEGTTGRCIDPPYDCSPPGYGGSCSWSSGCSCTSWVDGACGGGSCAASERRQTRDCTPDGCSSESRCVSDASCGGAPPPSCTVNLTPDTASVQVGSNTTLTASVTVGSGTVTQTDFASGNTGIVTVSPTSDSTVVYSTQASGVSVGSTTVQTDVIMSGASRCNDTSTVNVINAGPWWQVVDADITSNGDIISPIPGTCSLPVCNPVLGLKGAGGFPGVPAYGGATADFQAGSGSGNAAESPYNWLAASRYLGRTYDYAFFERQIPDDVVFNELTPPVTGGTFNSGGAPSRGYVWYHWDGSTLGDLTIDGNVNLVGSRRVVLMVEGANLIIDGRIQLQSPGQGFFMAVVGKDGSGFKGDILVDPSVDIIEGIFLAESEFKTGLSSSQFNVRGSVVAYDGVVLERDLGASNANTPAEVFTYAPDIIATFPGVFTQRRIRWKEVAP